MTFEYPESSSDCYIDQDDLVPGDERLLLDADKAANYIGDLISSFTHEEVDGDGDAWSIVCEHLASLFTNLDTVIAQRSACSINIRNALNHEYGYSIGGS